jgi:hypothetical protein
MITGISVHDRVDWVFTITGMRIWSAVVTLAGIELMHMIRKGQLKAARRLRPANQFYSLAG